MGAYHPLTWLGTDTTGRATEFFHIRSSRRQSKPADNILDTAGGISLKNAIVERRIKRLTVGSRILLLHSTKMWM